MSSAHLIHVLSMCQHFFHFNTNRKPTNIVVLKKYLYLSDLDTDCLKQFSMTALLVNSVILALDHTTTRLWSRSPPMVYRDYRASGDHAEMVTSIRKTSRSRNVKFGIQVGSDWPQMGQIWDFLKSVSLHFCYHGPN